MKMLASPFYHSLHIVQLRVLYKLTGESIFKEVADKWASLFKEKVDKLAQNGIKDTTKLIGDMWDTTKEGLESAEDELEQFTKESNLDLMKSRKESKETLLTSLETDLDKTEIDIAAARGELAALRTELEKEE